MFHNHRHELPGFPGYSRLSPYDIFLSITWYFEPWKEPTSLVLFLSKKIFIIDDLKNGASNIEFINIKKPPRCRASAEGIVCRIHLKYGSLKAFSNRALAALCRYKPQAIIRAALNGGLKESQSWLANKPSDTGAVSPLKQRNSLGDSRHAHPNFSPVTRGKCYPSQPASGYTAKFPTRWLVFSVALPLLCIYNTWLSAINTVSKGQ